MKSVTISSGHGLHIRGAADILDEVDEARKVVEKTAEYLRKAGLKVTVFHDNTSKDQSTNLNTIVNAHNKSTRELDVSVHLNAHQHTSKPMGTECLYKTQELLAKQVARNISVAADLINRGPKYRKDLKFLNSTNKPAILVEVCFVDSVEDSNLYRANFNDVCLALAEAIAGKAIDEGPHPIEPSEPEDNRPTVSSGDEGPYVQMVQEALGIIPFDGDFGSVTDGGVKGFQAACGLVADGVVGPLTWEELDDLNKRKAGGNEGLTVLEISAISDIAQSSAISRYSWKDRNVAPTGWTTGLALCFATAVKRLSEGDPAVEDMAQADRDDPDKDVLSHYAAEFKKANMDNSVSGVDTLRHLFALILGLGMRESSGRYCEGRDMSATNVAADTAEAGCLQTSWNIRSFNPNIPPLLEEWWDNPNGFLQHFQLDVEPDSNDLGVYGSGDGAEYQFLSKFAPLFHVFVSAVGLRYAKSHWGPIARRECELKTAADEMLKEVQDYIKASADIA